MVRHSLSPFSLCAFEMTDLDPNTPKCFLDTSWGWGRYKEHIVLASKFRFNDAFLGGGGISL